MIGFAAGDFRPLRFNCNGGHIAARETFDAAVPLPILSNARRASYHSPKMLGRGGHMRHVGLPHIGLQGITVMDAEATLALSHLISQLSRNAGYLARKEVDAILEKIRPDPKRLEPFSFKVYSQNGEDGIIEEIFSRLGIKRGRFCEIGVQNGLECNSLYLIHKGWQGRWIEGDKTQHDRIMNKFSTLVQGGRLGLVTGFVTAENINEMFSRVGIFDEELDFLSIDIDGNDIYLLEALQATPKVICIEYNSKFPPPSSKKPVYNPANAWRGGDYMGSSLVAIDEVARNNGYALVATDIAGVNAFFVRSDLAGDLFCPDRSAANLYNPPRYWLTLDLYRNIGHPADFGPYTDLVE